MSGALHGPLVPPLLGPEQAGKLLEEVIYERVLSCIDIDALLQFECELGCAFDECGFDDKPEAPDLAKQLIDRALHRAHEERWVAHLRGTRSCDFEPSDCELCAEEAAHRAAKPQERGTS